MMSTLGEFVAKRREELGLNQTELAKVADLPRTTINRIESGTTKLPTPEFRRRLARALRVSHIDILVAAGELLADEVAESGVRGVVEETGNLHSDRLHYLIDEFEWNEEQTENVAFAILSNHRRGRALIGELIESMTENVRLGDMSEEDQREIRDYALEHGEDLSDDDLIMVGDWSDENIERLEKQSLKDDDA